MNRVATPTVRHDAAETRQRLLVAAGRIFAEKGYPAATVSAICAAAKANIAAINYHFGGKEALYAAAWRHAFDRSQAAYPPDGGVPEDAPAEERLRGRIAASIRRITDDDSHGYDIVHREMLAPTGLLTRHVRRALKPVREGMRALIRELLGPTADERQVHLCQMSIRAQTFGPLMHQRQQRAHGRSGTPIPADPAIDVDILIDHATRFCLAGIAAIRAMTAPATRRRRPC